MKILACLVMFMSSASAMAANLPYTCDVSNGAGPVSAEFKFEEAQQTASFEVPNMLSGKVYLTPFSNGDFCGTQISVVAKPVSHGKSISMSVFETSVSKEFAISFEIENTQFPYLLHCKAL